MRNRSVSDRRERWSATVLLPLMLVYGAASLLHFLHNAVYLHDYPNLPAWLTSNGVLAAWLVVAGTGIAGYLMNLTILLEAATAVVLLTCVALSLLQPVSPRD